MADASSHSAAGVPEPIRDSFENVGLCEELTRAIYRHNFNRPSVIQGRALRPMLEGRNVIGHAQSGTGKTVAYVIAALQHLDASSTTCQSLVLVPTREVALEVQRMMLALGQTLGVRCFACTGNTPVRPEIDKFREGQQCVIGTPGKVADMMRRRHLRVDSVKFLVLDEIDEMLCRGFGSHIYEVFRLLPVAVQVCLFSSATCLAPEVVDLTSKFMPDAVQILVRSLQPLSLEGVRQFYIDAEREAWKLDTLFDLCECCPTLRAVVYVSTLSNCKALTANLQKHGISACCMHNGLDPNEREIAVRKFHSGTARMLVATDLLVRGLDDQRLGVVINYDLPQQMEKYLHRVGRNGKFNGNRVAISLVTSDDLQTFRAMERYFCTHIQELPADIGGVF